MEELPHLTSFLAVLELPRTGAVLDLGFSEGKPVAAFTLYNCLLHWKSFEAEKTSIFDRLIQIIGSTIEVTSCSLKSFFCLC